MYYNKNYTHAFILLLFSVKVYFNRNSSEQNNNSSSFFRKDLHFYKGIYLQQKLNLKLGFSYKKFKFFFNYEFPLHLFCSLLYITFIYVFVTYIQIPLYP